MNLRHIDAFLEMHSAGWKPFSGDFKLDKDAAKKIGRVALTAGLSQFAAGGAGSAAGTHVAVTGEEARAEKKANTDAMASADAASRQALFDAATAEGLAKLALKKKRGYAASMIVPSSPTLGNSSTLGA